MKTYERYTPDEYAQIMVDRHGYDRADQIASNRYDDTENYPLAEFYQRVRNAISRIRSQRWREE